MAKVLIEETTLTDIADLIRESKGTTELYDPAKFSDEFREIIENGSSVLPPVLQEKTATENGEVVPDEGYYGLSKVVVDVEAGVNAIDITYADYIYESAGLTKEDYPYLFAFYNTVVDGNSDLYFARSVGNGKNTLYIFDYVKYTQVISIADPNKMLAATCSFVDAMSEQTPVINTSTSGAAVSAIMSAYVYYTNFDMGEVLTTSNGSLRLDITIWEDIRENVL